MVLLLGAGFAPGRLHDKFRSDLEHAEEHMEDIKRMEKPTGLICEKCGKEMVIKWGRHGSFLGCSGYPDCTNTRELTWTCRTSTEPT